MKKRQKYNLPAILTILGLVILAFAPVQQTRAFGVPSLSCDSFYLNAVNTYNASTYDASVGWTGSKQYMVDVTIYIYNSGTGADVYSGYGSLPTGSATVYGLAYGATYEAHLVGDDTDGGSWDEYCNGSVSVSGPPASPDFTLSCTPASTTITAGSSTSFNLSTGPQNGFNSAVSFSHSMSPGGTQPNISYSNNNQIPAATTVANITTTAATTPATYTITFTGAGGSKTHACNVTLTVNAAPPSPSYGFNITPVTVDVMAPDSLQFTISATCSGGATGPIYNLAASSAFSNLTYTFSNTTLSCGSSVTLTVGNTGAIGAGQFSTPQARLGQSLNITGSGN